MVFKAVGVASFLVLLLLTINLTTRRTGPAREIVNTEAAFEDTVEGTLKVEIDDFEDGQSKTRYFVEREENGTRKRTEIDYKGEKDLITGSKVKVSGKKTTDTTLALTESGEAEPVAILEEASFVTAATTGTKKMAVVLIRTQEYPSAASPSTTQMATIFNGSPVGAANSVKHWLLANSFNLYTVTADVFGWYTIPRNFSCDVFENAQNYINGTTADNAINFDNYEQVVFVVNVPSGSGCPVLARASLGAGSFENNDIADGSSWSDIPYANVKNGSATNLLVLVHELGHNLGGNHAHGYDCLTSIYNTSCSGVDYGDVYDTLGKPSSTAFHYNAFYKNLFGWMSNIRTVTTSGDYDIYPIETAAPAGGYQALKINAGPQNYFLVENRIRTGYDTNLPSTAPSGNIVNGAPIRYLSVGGNRSYLLDAMPESITDEMRDTSDAGFPYNTEFFDSIHGIRITPLSKTNNVLKVRVALEGLVANTKVNIGTFAAPAVNIAKDTTYRTNFASQNIGPMKVEVTNNRPVLTSQRAIYRLSGVVTSFNEMMGLPGDQLDTTYWLPWYNSRTMDSQIRIANLSTSLATIHVYVAGAEVAGSPFTLAAGASVRKTFANIDAGPLKIVSNVNIVASERIIHKHNSVATSLSETMAFPNRNANIRFWVPFYNNKDLDTQLHFINVSSQTATINVAVGGVAVAGSPFTLAAGAAVRKSFAGISGGPVKIDSNTLIAVSERVIYNVNGVPTSYSEVMATSRSGPNYYLPWYENTAAIDTQIRIGNTSTSNASVRIFIGGREMVGSPFTVPANGNLRKNFTDGSTGPVKIESNWPIVAGLRTIYKVGGVATSYTEIMGATTLSNIHWFPWYNHVDIDSQLRVGYP
jgi:M6 family metalloprotease-like protein